MKDLILPKVPSALSLALIVSAALILTQLSAQASNQPAGGVSPQNVPVGPALHPVLNVSALTAIRTGPHTVRVNWAFAGTNPKGFYLFHVASATTPPADWETGGWHNDLIVAGTARQAVLNVDPATKPQRNYFLICVAGQGSAYTCSSVFAEAVQYTAPMMVH
jgi:hypothetical protein